MLKNGEKIVKAFRSGYRLHWGLAMKRYQQVCETEFSAEVFEHVQTELVYGNAYFEEQPYLEHFNLRSYYTKFPMQVI